MPIAQGRAEAHVAEWVRGLSLSRAPYRQLWPRFVFRHEEISNAVRIIKSGSLLSRAQAVGYRDVAAVDIVTSTERAHAFSRLYFRPMSPTQYRIEGIRRPSEVWHGAHAPVLVMFAFDAVSVLSRTGTQFSNGNMQSAESSYDFTESLFSAQLPLLTCTMSARLRKIRRIELYALDVRRFWRCPPCLWRAT
ncbi:DarT ssDNA thymidine ADP-ribosyltransferase family protein [Xanthomonas arboricola]|uniref:DarT ssDNA thymidine ADP-ribosyltransferase family protein n=1 Tax=Xanthomonas arboricola TaxID=56448 RepID=UPI0009C06EF2